MISPESMLRIVASSGRSSIVMQGSRCGDSLGKQLDTGSMGKLSLSGIVLGKGNCIRETINFEVLNCCVFSLAVVSA